MIKDIVEIKQNKKEKKMKLKKEKEKEIKNEINKEEEIQRKLVEYNRKGKVIKIYNGNIKEKIKEENVLNNIKKEKKEKPKEISDKNNNLINIKIMIIYYILKHFR